jgi:endonuclease YncB( thermonuclease family)
MLILASVAVLVVWLSIDLEKDYSGRVFVIDGDTVMTGEEKIRLEGIDAPELGQLCVKNGIKYKCGIKSKAHLNDLAQSGQMHCRAWQRDKYERLLGTCFVGDVNINGRMVGDGWAVAFGGFYGEEANARQSGAGLWVGEFDRPREWRSLHRGAVE